MIELNDEEGVELLHNKPIIRQLINYLKTSDDSLLPEDTVDLYRLFTELAAMKVELKHASRQMKTGLEDFKNVFTVLEQSNSALTAVLEQRSKEDQVLHAIKPLLMTLIELYDRLEISAASMMRYKPDFIERFCGKRRRQFWKSHQEGQQLLLSHVSLQLTHYQVVPIDAIGKPFDPHLMFAVDIHTDTEKPNGIVLKELGKGYLWKSHVLRVSEVCVNKWSTV